MSSTLFIGRGAENRTLTNGFGDHYSTVKPLPYKRMIII